MAEPDETRRRRGGEELPDEVQDRPEQNRGYDDAVRGEGRDAPGATAGTDDDLPDADEPPPTRSVDDEAARRAAADVRRRERRSR